MSNGLNELSRFSDEKCSKEIQLSSDYDSIPVSSSNMKPNGDFLFVRLKDE